MRNDLPDRIMQILWLPLNTLGASKNRWVRLLSLPVYVIWFMISCPVWAPMLFVALVATAIRDTWRGE